MQNNQEATLLPPSFVQRQHSRKATSECKYPSMLPSIGELIASQIASEIAKRIPFESLNRTFMNERYPKMKQQSIQYMENINDVMRHLTTIPHENRRKKKCKNQNSKASSLGKKPINLKTEISGEKFYLRVNQNRGSVRKSSRDNSYVNWDEYTPSISQSDIESEQQNEGKVINAQKRLSRKPTIIKTAYKKSNQFQNINQNSFDIITNRNSRTIRNRRSNFTIKREFNRKKGSLDVKPNHSGLIPLIQMEDDDPALLQYIEKLRMRKSKLADIMIEFQQIQHMKELAKKLSEMASFEKGKNKANPKINQKPLVTNLEGEVLKAERKDFKRQSSFLQKMKIKPIVKLKDSSIPSGTPTRFASDAQDKENQKPHGSVNISDYFNIGSEQNHQPSFKPIESNRQNLMVKKSDSNNSKSPSIRVQLPRKVNKNGNQQNYFIKSIMDVMASRKHISIDRRKRRNNAM